MNTTGYSGLIVNGPKAGQTYFSPDTTFHSYSTRLDPVGPTCDDLNAPYEDLTVQYDTYIYHQIGKHGFWALEGTDVIATLIAGFRPRPEDPRKWVEQAEAELNLALDNILGGPF